MTEEAVVEKVGELMETLDEVKKYRELAYAMIDFAAIVAVAMIVAVALVIFYGVYQVFIGPLSQGLGPQPVSGLVVFALLFAAIFGAVGGTFWVTRRVRHTKVGEWKDTLKEGTPGAVKLLSETDWDSTLRMVSLSRASYLLYAVLKLAAYSILLGFVLFFVGGVFGFLGALLPQAYVWAVAVTVVLFFSRKGLSSGFRRMQSLDLLFWDLRVFSAEFKRAEFNKT